MVRCTRTTPMPNSTDTLFLAPAQPLSNPAGTQPFDPFGTSDDFILGHHKKDDPLEEVDQGWQCESFPTRYVYLESRLRSQSRLFLESG
jgi:hypothetical protein